MEQIHYVYILVNNSEKYKNHSYIGYTNNPKRRIRQHNCEIKGGAKATHGKENAWEFAVLINGFQNMINALSCEWKIKHPGKKKYYKIEGKIKTLNEVLKLEQWTNKCTIKNNECLYDVFLKDEYMHLLEIDSLPKNISVHKMSNHLINT
jgi:predicted GIY-YIG superfamily endonuclease